MVRTQGRKPSGPTPPPKLRFIKSNQFKVDYEHHAKADRHKAAAREIWPLLELLRQHGKIPDQYKCHNLKGEWKGWRDCHTEGDFVVIWKYAEVGGEELVVLGACGTHAYLGI